MDKFYIAGDDGNTMEVPCQQFYLNPKQQFLAVGTHMIDRLDISSLPDIEITHIGKLSDQNSIFFHMVLNSLRKQGWDLEKYPDPEIVMLTDKRILN